MINLDLWALGYAVDDRNKLRKVSGAPGVLSTKQKTSARLKQHAFPTILCNVLSKAINGDANCLIITCISPSPYNGSETAFTMDFGERFSNLVTHPVPCPLEDYEKLVKNTRESLKDNFEALQNLEKSIAGRKNRIYSLRFNIVQAKSSQLTFLESLMVMFWNFFCF